MVALWVAALLLQEPAPPPELKPAELLKKVEEKYASAASLTATMVCKVVGTFAGQQVDDTWIGSIQSKGKGQLRMEWSAPPSCKAQVPAMAWISDGKSMTIVSSGKASPAKPHAMELGTWGRRFFSRVGIVGVMAPAYGALYLPRAVPLDSVFRVGELADAGTEKFEGVECRVLKWKYVPPEKGAQPVHCRVWIDPKTFTIRKHESVKRSATQSITVTETYQGQAFDRQIPDDAFKLP